MHKTQYIRTILLRLGLAFDLYSRQSSQTSLVIVGYGAESGVQFCDDLQGGAPERSAGHPTAHLTVIGQVWLDIDRQPC
jgi:hypothetical protein